MDLRRQGDGGPDYLEGDGIEPSNLSKQKVEEFACQVAKAGKFNPGNPVEDLVRRFGGRIRYQDMDDWLEQTGSIFVHKKWDFEIILPNYTSPRRDQFTLAHELGHYFLHSNQGEKPLVATRSGMSKRVEWEANWFAAGLLMPAEAFEEAYRKNHDSDVLAVQFGVSSEAASVRVRALGCE